MIPLSREIAKFLDLLKFRQEDSVVSLKVVKVVLKADQTQNKIFEDTLSLEKMGRSGGAWYVEVYRDLRLEEKQDCMPTSVIQKQQISQYLLMLYDLYNTCCELFKEDEPVESIASWQ